MYLVDGCLWYLGKDTMSDCVWVWLTAASSVWLFHRSISSGLLLDSHCTGFIRERGGEIYPINVNSIDLTIPLQYQWWTAYSTRLYRYQLKLHQYQTEMSDFLTVKDIGASEQLSTAFWCSAVSEPKVTFWFLGALVCSHDARWAWSEVLGFGWFVLENYRGEDAWGGERA